MSVIFEERFASHPNDAKSYDTAQLREHFLIEKVMEDDRIRLVYSHYDRYISGGAVPANGPLELTPIEPMKAPFFCDRRELGIIDVGAKGMVVVDGIEFPLDFKEALYVGKGVKQIIFESESSTQSARFYLNSTLAHKELPTRHITLKDANVLQMGSSQTSNERQINQLLISKVVETCQLQMGMTELRPGSVWNTMPAHTHSRRMEVYFYFNVPEGQAVCHFMGQPQETRHIWMVNEQAVISPNWSIHSAAGTSNYIFIWGMAGENMDYTDMDVVQAKRIKIVSMNRRNAFKYLSLMGLLPVSGKLQASIIGISPEVPDRKYWLKVMTKIATPVLESLSNGELKKNMPVECKPGMEADRRKVTYLEAFGRLMAGMAPWLELGIDETEEGQLRKKYILLVQKSMKMAVDPQSPDFMNFTEGGQPLVDAAFLAHAILRAPHVLWTQLDSTTKQQLIAAMKSSRVITPGNSNWLLFSAMVEAFLLFAGEQPEEKRIDLAIEKHMEWYKGDGMYGDGPDFHWDYYNSFVIQPMLVDVLQELIKHDQKYFKTYELVIKRARRYAAIQEKLISPEGTFPAIGRSLPYRFGAFQLLAQMALQHQLPEDLMPSQVRPALSAVIQRMIEAQGVFDSNGWLTIGFYGHQPNIGESYISTGSLYLCTVGLLPLGLAPNDPFWTDAPMDWTSKKIWSGQDFQADHAINE